MFRKNTFIFICVLLVSACSNRPKEVLSMKEMANVLVELHTLDGVFATGEYRSLDTNEKNKYYEAVLEKHRIDQAQFDSSLVWYSRDPKKFEKIYVRVVDRLTAEENDVKTGKYYPIVPKDSLPIVLTTAGLWKDSTRFVLKNDSSARNQLAFTIVDSALMMQDTYVLRFLHRIEPEDSCDNQHIHFNVHYANGQVDSLYCPVLSDGKLRRYTLRLHAGREEKIDSLSGRIFALDSCLFAQNAYVDSISLVRKYNADIQETLRTKTELHEAYRTFEYRLFPLPSERFDFIPRKKRVNIL